MTRVVHRFDSPERFVAGTVGMPGERTFYLQAREGRRLTSVALEKQQVILLTERLDALLEEVARREPTLEVPDEAPTQWQDNLPLETPITEEFRVGALGLGWDVTAERVIVEAHAQGEDDDAVPIPGDDPDPDVNAPDVMSVRLTPAQARGFASRARLIVAAGRPPCPFCALPLDASGHVCPRANGYRR
jgi:uncharacterized repeat protein (TIGR03847 family)